MAPRISIALCTFKGERFLQEQLDSFSLQTRPPFELVVCDDGSEDRTLQILEAYSASAPFAVHIYRNRRRLGPAANFDQAMRLCCGEYISLADQDDRWRPEKLARLAGVLDQEPEVGAVFSDATLIDAESQPVRGSLWKKFRFGPSMRTRFAEKPGTVLLQRDVVSGNTLLFRRSLLAHFPAIPGSWLHDGWLTWMSILWTRLRFLPAQLSEYRLHPSQSLGLRSQAVGGARAHHAHTARQFAELLCYLEQASPELAEQWRGRLEQKIAFLSARSAAPHSQMKRMIFILNHARSYFALARGWRSMYRDWLIDWAGAG